MAELAVDECLEQMAFDVTAGQEVREDEAGQIAGQGRAERHDVGHRAVDVDGRGVVRGEAPDPGGPCPLADGVLAADSTQAFRRSGRQPLGNNTLIRHCCRLDLQQHICRFVSRGQGVIKQNVDGEAHRRRGLSVPEGNPFEVGALRFRVARINPDRSTSSVATAIAAPSRFVLGVREIMLRFLPVVFALLLGLFPATARADVEVGFWTRELGLDLPHAFFTIKGNIDGKPVEESYGFTAKTITPALLWGPVPGRIDLTTKGYMAASNRLYSVTVPDAVYARLRALVDGYAVS